VASSPPATLPGGIYNGMFSAAIKGESTSSHYLPNQNTYDRLGAADLLSGEDPAGAE